MTWQGGVAGWRGRVARQSGMAGWHDRVTWQDFWPVSLAHLVDLRLVRNPTPKHKESLPWWHVSLVPAHRRQRQAKLHEFKASIFYIVSSIESSCLKKI